MRKAGKRGVEGNGGVHCDEQFSRHIDIRRYFVRELVSAGTVKLIPSRTHEMVADALTKSLPATAFIAHRKVM